MRDPHVMALRYDLESTDPEHDFGSATALTGAIGDFDYELSAGRLVAKPRPHFADERGARAAVKPHLRSWEQRTFLALGARIRFKYRKADIIDRHPVPGVVEVRPEPITMHLVGHAPTVIVGHAAYPAPDPTYKATPLTDKLVERIARVRDRHAELPATAYWVLTQVDDAFGSGKGSQKRTTAAERLNVEDHVVRTLGRLTNKRDPSVGRKAGGVATPFTPNELTWLDATMKRLALQVGQAETGRPIDRLRMADLPPL